jgi:hypothetical protein
VEAGKMSGIVVKAIDTPVPEAEQLSDLVWLRE